MERSGSLHAIIEAPARFRPTVLGDGSNKSTWV
jgi:hypothetical protein